jgi:preprotein translocase subunit SecB
MDAEKQPGIKIAQIVLERAEFSHRADFLEHVPTTPMELDVKIAFSAGVTPDHQRAMARLTAEAADDQLYKFSFQILALLEVDTEAPNYPLPQYVAVNAGSMLFPFLREIVANVTSRGRFGPVWLKPFNIQAAVQASVASPDQGAIAANS